ncbi:MAG: metallophosphoesterase [Phycisphaerae bacterium]
MLIGVISDTHDRLPAIRAGLGLLSARGVAAVIHPGDFVAPFAVRALLEVCAVDGGSVTDAGAPARPTLYATFGNNDGERDGLKRLMPSVQDGPLFVELGGRVILVHHFIDWCDRCDIERADIVVTGHTHEVVNRFDEGRLVLNPGECCGWVTGRCTVAVLDTDGPSAEVCEVSL